MLFMEKSMAKPSEAKNISLTETNSNILG